MRLGAVLGLTAAVAGLAALLLYEAFSTGSDTPPSPGAGDGGDAADVGVDPLLPGDPEFPPGPSPGTPPDETGPARTLFVLDASNGSPVEGASVRLRTDPRGGWSSSLVQRRTDDAGVVSFTSGALAPVEALASSAVHPLQTATVTARADGAFETRLRSGPRLSGRVVIAGGRVAPTVPLRLRFVERRGEGGSARQDGSGGWTWPARDRGGQDVLVDPSRGVGLQLTTSARGEFAAALPEPGTWEVVCLDAGESEIWTRQLVEVPSAGATVSVQLDDACVLRLDVTGTEGGALPARATARVVPEDPRPGAAVSFGVLRVPVERVVRSGAFRVHLHLQGGVVLTSDAVYARSGDDVNVSIAVAPPEIAVRLTVEDRPDVSGLRVFRMDGPRLAAVLARAEPPDDDEPGVLALGPPGAGPATFLVVDPATGAGTAFGPPIDEEEWTCRIGATGGIRLTFEGGERRGAKVELRALAGPADAVWAARFEPDDVWMGSEEWGVEGRFERLALHGVPAGDHEITVTPSGRAPIRRKVSVRAASWTELTIGDALR